MDELRHWSLETTMYHHSKPTAVAAYIQQGFTHPLVMHVALALRNTFSFIQPHHIAGAWGSSYSTGQVNTTGGEIGSTVQDGIVLGNEQVVHHRHTFYLAVFACLHTCVCVALICGHDTTRDTHYSQMAERLRCVCAAGCCDFFFVAHPRGSQLGGQCQSFWRHLRVAPKASSLSGLCRHQLRQPTGEATGYASW